MELLAGAVQFTEQGRVLGEEQQSQILDIQEVVDAGMRAQLNVESLVTGQLLVDLDFPGEIHHPKDRPYLSRDIASEISYIAYFKSME